MELSTQKYLRSGKTPEDLEKEFGIKFKEKDGVYIFSYSQTESPKTNIIVMECRGLVLDKKSDWEIVSFPFLRFFNHNEANTITGDFNFKDSHVLEKIDGSLISVSFHENRFRIFTRGTIDASGTLPRGDITFNELFLEIIKDINCLNKTVNYIFEIVSPRNQIITPYPFDMLYLIGARDKSNNFKELGFKEIEEEAKRIGVLTPSIYPLNGLHYINSYTKNMGATKEGFVCVNYGEHNERGGFHRVKVKNPSYVALSNIKGLSGDPDEYLLQIILNGDLEEFISYFPEYKKQAYIIYDNYLIYKKMIEETIEKTQEFLTPDEITPESRKDFAIKIKFCPELGFMFKLLDKKVNSWDEYVSSQNDMKKFSKKLLKNFSKVSKEYRSYLKTKK